MKVFSAQRYAGSITLDCNGESKELEVAVLDMPGYEQFRKLQEESKAKADKLKALGDDATDEQKEELGNNTIDDLMKQIKVVLPDAHSSDFRGFSINQMVEIIQYCVSLSAGGLKDERTPEQKKTVSRRRSKRSPSRGRASHSRQSMAGA